MIPPKAPPKKPLEASVEGPFGESFRYRRFFYPFPEPIAALEAAVFPLEVTLPESPEAQALAHQLEHVLRMKPGNQLILVDSRQERAYFAQIQALKPKALCFKLLKALPQNLSNRHQQPFPLVTVAAAMIKPTRWEWLLEKTTELGARHLVPLETDRTVLRLSQKQSPKQLAEKQRRWQLIAQAAASQSEGLFVPEVALPQSLEGWLKTLPVQQNTDTLRFLLLERGEDRQPWAQALTQQLLPQAKRMPKTIQELILAFGPEGGWTDTEIEAFLAHGFQPVSLGSRVLRCETAVAACLSTLVCLWDCL